MNTDKSTIRNQKTFHFLVSAAKNNDWFYLRLSAFIGGYRIIWVYPELMDKKKHMDNVT